MRIATVAGTIAATIAVIAAAAFTAAPAVAGTPADATTINGIVTALGGNDLLSRGAGIDTLTGGRGRDAVAFTGDPFAGVDLSAAGRTVVNTPDELLDFDPTSDKVVLDRSDLGVGRKLDLVNGTVDQLTARGRAGSDAGVVVIQGAIGNAGAAASAIAATGVASGPGVFVYWNTTLLIGRVVFSADLGDPTAGISVLGNIRTLSGDAALATLPTFTGRTFDTQR